MGAYDGAELCELKTREDDWKKSVILPGTGIEKLRKEMVKFFKELGLGVTIDGNIAQTDVLNLWLDLKNNSFKAMQKTK